ncbi:Helicase IV [Acidipropionibacterium jensenii]|uniref:Helicase IV n=1 Tax=Acidipropionibacterium jensenii TaxID=1749 RepID=A0A448NW33_9ACTN|nr:RNA polymerase recycling motor ATPase HelR [Acidipropionibacterium jensenii]QCV88885.1 AAA family ATPase [Acidipropionibacterium jensenii]VEI02098.1 Helicase IV [Acidipropionibacterium jensenii]
MPLTTPGTPHDSLFELSGRAAAKATPALLGPDPDRLAEVVARVRSRRSQLHHEIETLRRAPGGLGRGALDRDQSIHRLTRQLGVLERFGPDIVLGRMSFSDGREPVYVGRLGLSDDHDRRLLVDWRAPAAEPFFAATSADPMGLSSRRRYQWVDGRVRDYWDEILDADSATAGAALDDQSSFIASLGSARTPQMRDVLATIAADQDAVIRARSRGALVVEGGPGTGKTVVALHRAAYLLYADPRLDGRAGAVLLVGPHAGYLNYVAGVLPSLGEDGVRAATLAEMVPQGRDAVPEPDRRVAALKSAAAMVGAVDPAVGLYEEAPTGRTVVETPWVDLDLDPEDWAEAFDAPAPSTPHNEARDQIWEALVEILVDKVDPQQAPVELVRRALLDNEELRRLFSRTWPVLDPAQTVADLWSVPAYLRRCAPWLSQAEVAALQRPESRPWTDADLPLLDAARRRIGDPAAAGRRRRREKVMAEQRRYMDDVVDYVLASDDNPDSSLSMLRGEDLRDALMDPDAVEEPDRDPLAGPFAHVIVDEAQELTDAQWQMLMRRCPSLSFTIVGDRAQARSGFEGSWRDRLTGLGFSDVTTRTLRVNYRTPAEVMAEAAPVILAQVPDAVVPSSIRRGGAPLVHGRIEDLDAVLDRWLADHPDGTACVIAAETDGVSGVRGVERPRVQVLSPTTVKGLEFDLVVIVEPLGTEQGRALAVDRYVSMTRTTGQLVILTR